MHDLHVIPESIKPARRKNKNYTKLAWATIV
jgi:hypothetical protein